MTILPIEVLSRTQQCTQLVLRFRSSRHIAAGRSLVLEIICIDRRPRSSGTAEVPDLTILKGPGAQQSPGPLSMSALG